MPSKHCKASQELVAARTVFDNTFVKTDDGMLMRVGTDEDAVIRLVEVNDQLMVHKSAQFLRALKLPIQPQMESSAQLEPFMVSVYTGAAAHGITLEQEPHLLYSDTFPYAMVFLFTVQAARRGVVQNIEFLALFDMTKGY